MAIRRSTRLVVDPRTPVEHGTSADDGVARPHVFVSYSRSDEAFVRRLDAALRERGLNVWVDWDDIPPTADWRARIYAGIEAALSFVAVLSPDLVASEICRDELAHAVSSKKRVVPVVVREVDRRATPDELLVPNWIFFRESDDFERAVDELVDALETDLEWLDDHARLLVRAVEWERERRDVSFVLRGRDLNEAESWLSQQGSHREAASPLHVDFIVASRKAAARRQRLVLTGVVVALGVAVLLGTVAWIQRNHAIEQSKISRSRELAVTSLAQHELDPRRSLVLALEAIDAWRTPEAEAALRRWLLTPLRATFRGQVNDGIDVGAISPNGNLVVASGDERAIVARTATGERVATLGPVGDPTSTVFSPDGTLIATTAWADPESDNTAQIWRAATGKLLTVLTGHEGVFTKIAFSTNGKLVVAAGDHGQVRLWQVAGGKQLAVPESNDGMINDVAFSADGKLIVAAGSNGTARVWRTANSRQQVVLQGHKGRINDASFSADGKLIVTAGDDRTARIWNPSTGEQLASLKGHTARVNAAVVSADDTLIATAADDGTARIWSAVHGGQLAVLKGHGPPKYEIAYDANAKPVTTVAFSPDNAFVITAGADQTARVWQTTTGRQLAIVRRASDDIVAAAFGADGTARVVTGSDDGTARVWQPPLVRELVASDWFGEVDAPVHAVFGSDGEVIGTNDGDNMARRWETATGKPLPLLNRGRFAVSNAFFSADGSRIVTAGEGIARILQTTTGKELGALEGFDGTIVGVAFSPNGKLIVTRSDSAAITVWRTNTWKPVPLVGDGQDDIQDVTFSPDGKLFVTLGFDPAGRIWSESGGRPLRVIRAPGEENVFIGAAFSPDGRRLATVDLRGVARLSRTETGEQLGRLSVQGQEVLRLVFSPDGQLILTAGSDGTARLWRTTTVEQVAVLSGHDQFVTALGFSPDGRLLVTGGEDHTARLWLATNGEQLAVLRGHNAAVIQASFSPNRKLILTTANDGTARIYPCDACGSLTDVEAEAKRISGMTPDEREYFLKTP